MTPDQFFSLLRAYCYATGASVTSYGRTMKHNADVGGVPQSAHKLWLGADVVYDVYPLFEVAGETAERLGLRLIREGDHDHLQPFDWRAG